MTRLFGHYVALEMFFLWLLEFMLCSAVLYVLLASGAASSASSLSLSPGSATILADAAILAFAAGTAAIAIGLYQPEIYLSTGRILLSTGVAALAALPVLFGIGRALGIDTRFLVGPDWMQPLRFVLAWTLVLFVTRLAFSTAVRLNLLARRVLIIGASADAAPTQAAISTLRRGFFTVAGVRPAHDEACLAVPALKRQGVWGVVVTSEARGAVPQDALLTCKYAGIRIFSDVEFREQQLRRIDLKHLEPDWVLFAHGIARGRVERATRRAFDIASSLVLLFTTLPVMLMAAVAIRLDSPGPVLYRQERVGLQGRVFTLLKFRSMRTDAERAGPAWATQSDPRVTRVGAILRRSRIDELPQLFNVLRGEMSFVGPRPERPHFVNQLAGVIPFYRDRASVKPGITGWAQVNFPYGASIEDARQKLSYDLYYVRHRSLFLDVLILFATVRVILFQEGSR